MSVALKREGVVIFCAEESARMRSSSGFELVGAGVTDPLPKAR